MLRQLAAILFVFVIAGQVSAGVCGCFDDVSKPQHSCCKRQKLKGDSIRPTNCCDADCAMRQSERLPQDRAQVVDNIKQQQTSEPAVVKRFSFEPFIMSFVPRPLPTLDHRLKLARAPDLVVLNCAFLI